MANLPRSLSSYVFAECFEGLFADVVLNFAGVLPCGFLVYAKTNQILGQQLMPGVHPLGDFHAGLGEGDVAVAVHGNIAALPQAFRGIADGGLGHAQLFRHIKRTDIAVLLLHHQHGFQIVFRGSVYRHGKLHQLSVFNRYRLTYSNRIFKQQRKWKNKP